MRGEQRRLRASLEIATEGREFFRPSVLVGCPFTNSRLRIPPHAYGRQTNPTQWKLLQSNGLVQGLPSPPGSHPWKLASQTPEQHCACVSQSLLAPWQVGRTAQSSPLHVRPPPQSVESGLPAQLQAPARQSTAPHVPHEPPHPSSPQVLP